MNPDRLALMVFTIARLLAGCRHVAIGARSPIPAAGALLARELAGGDMHVSILGSRRHTLFNDGGRELFDCAAQGRIDAFFLSGVQIDGSGNVNLLGLGSPEHIERRFAGNFGGPYLGFMIPRLILFRTDHDPRTLVRRVDFVSVPGSGPAGVERRGGPVALLTDLCLFRFERGGFRLESVHPGLSVEDVRARTGFAFEVPPEVPQTPAPPAEIARLMRGPVAAAVGEVYPLFAEQLAQA